MSRRRRSGSSAAATSTSSEEAQTRSEEQQPRGFLHCVSLEGNCPHAGKFLVLGQIVPNYVDRFEMARRGRGERAQSPTASHHRTSVDEHVGRQRASGRQLDRCLTDTKSVYAQIRELIAWRIGRGDDKAVLHVSRSMSLPVPNPHRGFCVLSGESVRSIPA